MRQITVGRDEDHTLQGPSLTNLLLSEKVRDLQEIDVGLLRQPTMLAKELVTISPLVNPNRMLNFSRKLMLSR
jgi:hypothetical protein